MYLPTLSFYVKQSISLVRMSDNSQTFVINKKRVASLPLQDPSDSYKRSKQIAEKSLSDINESYTVFALYYRL